MFVMHVLKGLFKAFLRIRKDKQRPVNNGESHEVHKHESLQNDAALGSNRCGASNSPSQCMHPTQACNCLFQSMLVQIGNLERLGCVKIL